MEKVINYNVILYPNPSVSTFSLNLVSDSEADVEISIFDLQGRNIENKTISKDNLSLITLGSNLPSGIYNVVVKQGDNVKSQRLTKN